MPPRERTTTWHDPIALARTARSMAGIDLLHAFQQGRLPPPPIMETIGYGLSEVEEGRVVFSLVPGEHHYNPIGVVHGGVAATLLDTAMACAVHTMLPAGTGYTTLELKVNYVRGLKLDAGTVRAEGKLIHLGQRVATAEGRLIGEDDRLYAHATTTCLILTA